MIKFRKMLKKALSLLIITSFILLSVNPSLAFIFKKRGKKTTEKPSQAVEQLIEKDIRLAVIFASWCPGCKNIQPTLDQIQKEYSDRVDLIYLDVSTPKNALESSKKAKELKLVDFYNANKSKTSTVAVIVYKSNEIVAIFQNNNKIEDYKTAIEQASTKAKSLENPPT